MEINYVKLLVCNNNMQLRQKLPEGAFFYKFLLQNQFWLSNDWFFSLGYNSFFVIKILSSLCIFWLSSQKFMFICYWKFILKQWNSKFLYLHNNSKKKKRKDFPSIYSIYYREINFPLKHALFNSQYKSIKKMLRRDNSLFYWLRKVHIDAINREKLYHRFADHK